MVAKELLDILVCPKCKGKIRFDEEQQTISCDLCRLAYPVCDGIPVMLIEEAKSF